MSKIGNSLLLFLVKFPIGEGPAKAANREGKGGAGPNSAWNLMRDVVRDASCGGSESSAPRIPARSYLAGSI